MKLLEQTLEKLEGGYGNRRMNTQKKEYPQDVPSLWPNFFIFKSNIINKTV